MIGLRQRASALVIFLFVCASVAVASATGVQAGEPTPSPTPSAGQSPSEEGTGDLTATAAQPSPSPSGSPSPSPSPTETTSPSPPPSSEPEPSPTPSPSATPSHGPTPPGDPSDEAEISLETTSGGFLTQVGDRLEYVVTVTNTGDSEAKDLVVQDLVPSEVQILTVSANDAVTATTSGQGPGGSAIVWILDLGPDETVQLTWTGRADAPGDLIAANTVRAKLDGEVVARASDRAFLATTARGRTNNTPIPLVKKKVVTFTEIALDPPTRSAAGSPEVAAGPGGTLPSTGGDISALYLAGVLIALGAVFLVMGRKKTRLSLSRGFILALFVFGTACVSSSPPAETRPEAAPSSAATGQSPAEEDADEEEDEEEVDTEVKGIQVEPDEPGDESAEPGEESSEPGPVAPPAVSNPLLPQPEVETPQPQTEIIREVETISVPLEMPLEELGDRPGDNALSFIWSEQKGLESAASSRLLVPGSSAEVLSGIGSSPDGLKIETVMTNTSDSKKLHVAGEVVLDITGPGGSSQLRSEALDLVLNPGGSTSVTFTFNVPTGEYFLSTSFDAS